MFKIPLSLCYLLWVGALFKEGRGGAVQTFWVDVNEQLLILGHVRPAVGEVSRL